MCEFVIGNVCIEVPQGIGLRTSLDGSCVTLDFEDSGFNGKMKLRKVVEEAKELAPAATAPVEKVSGASADIKAEKPSPTPPPPQLDSQTTKSSKISLSSDVKSDVKRPSSQEKKEIKPRRHQLVVASDGMDKPSGPSDTVSNETFETENMVTEEKQNKKPAAVVTTTTLDSAKNEKKQQKTKEQPAAGRKRKQLSLTEKKQNMRQRRMSDFGSKKPAMTTGAEHAYKKSSGVNWAKKEDLTALTPRCGATASFDPATEKVYVCGGLAEDGYLDDLWILDTKSWQWSQGGSSGLRKRAWHTSSIVNDKLLVFGGQCDLPKESRQDEEDDVKLLDELTMFDFETGVWFAAHTTGEAPCARSGHSATPIDNNRLVVFGGMNNEGMLMNDVHVLDTVLFSWSVPKTKGSPIKPRGYHTAVLIGHRIIFFGGIGKCNW
jgi:N-acetylneuraminic acid mutarotase